MKFSKFSVWMQNLICATLLSTCSSAAYGALAGGRPNAFSRGDNAFAGVVNPANAVWIADRFDIGAFWVHQKSSLTNYDRNPLFPPGKIDLTYKTKNLFTADAAINKRFKLHFGPKSYDTSVTLASYTMPSYVKLRTQNPLPSAGTTPIRVLNRTDVVSAIFSFKYSAKCSVGFSIDYLHLSHNRAGYQNSDNPQRSVSPGHVTNNGMDHSNGIGLSIGWRWKISEKLDFGAAWSKKSYCGQFRKYRGFEPHHAKNYTPQTFGAGFTRLFTKRLAGRLEVLWTNLGALPNANNNVLADGSLNLNKRGSKNSPGSGLQDATYINLGMGYKLNSLLSLGAGYSHRIKIPRKGSNILSHSYALQTIYDIFSLGANLNYQKHVLFLSVSWGFKNRVSGLLPIEIGGGRFAGEKQTASVSLSWGYLFN